MYILEANSEEPDQTPRSVASGLVLHCLQISHKKGARLKWVNICRLVVAGEFSLVSHVQK